MSDTRVSPYSLNDLKNTTDDALGNYLRGLSFKQDNSKLDVRLTLGYVAVVLGAATFAADYKLGWEATKGWTAIAIALYMVLNGVFTYWMYFVERGLVFEGTRNGKKLSVRSKTKKHDPSYYLTIETDSASSLTNVRQIKSPFTMWFTADGYFVAKPFQQWLASSVQAIGEADVKNAATTREEEHVLQDETAKASGIESKDGKGGKRGKKKKN